MGLQSVRSLKGGLLKSVSAMTFRDTGRHLMDTAMQPHVMHGEAGKQH